MRSGTEPNDDRRTATIVGVLFVVATVLYLIGGAVYGPSLESSDYLERAYPDRATVRLGVLLEHLTLGFLLAAKGSHDRGRLDDG